MEKWNGAFSPNLTKSIGRVVFVPLADMSARDWAWLDYDNIRTVARNRIANKIARGQLRGFFQVMITEKAKAKNEYFWPASQADVDAFAADQTPDFFRNVSEVDNDTDANEAVERIRAGVSILPLTTMMALYAALKEYLDEQDAEQVDKISEEHLEELGSTAKELMLVAILSWEYSLSEIESLVDDLPDDDETDDIRAWIENEMANIQSSRRQLAAGRGIN